MPNDFRPKFHNPEPLPSIDDFRLSTILQKHVPEENEAVKKALLNVAERHQNDLKLEIRRLLTVEQKIQYLNIDVAKRAHLLRRKVGGQKRRLERALELPNNGKEGTLYLEISQVMSLVSETSARTQALAQKVLEYERSNHGPISGPDPRKYPRLAKLFGTDTDSVDVNSTGSIVVEGYIDDEDDGSESVELNGEDEMRALLSREAQNEESTCSRNNDNELPSSRESPSEANADKADKADNSEEHREPTPEEMSPEMFEQLIDLNISKYRLKRRSKYKELNLFPPELSSKPSCARKSKSNPLRLLYSSLALANSDMLKSNVVDVETLKSPFVNSKSVATVLPTPQTSLHKKLRIRVQPLRYNKQNEDCACSEAAEEETGQNEADSSPAREALTRTLYHFLGADFDEEADRELDDELWSSSGIHSESEDDSDSSSNSSSNDDEVIDPLQEDELDPTSEAYQSIRKDLLRLRRKKGKKMNEQVLREFSPTPKHQPSHRTLKPKGSILKMSASSSRPSKSATFLLPKTPRVLASGLPRKANSPMLESATQTPYRASPRASFVSDVSALGMILGIERKQQDQEGGEDGDCEENSSIENSGTKPDVKDSGDYKSVDKLRSLLV